jgi:hypothetical protein
MSSNSNEALREACLAGLGIGLHSTWDVGSTWRGGSWSRCRRRSGAGAARDLAGAAGTPAVVVPARCGRWGRCWDGGWQPAHEAARSGRRQAPFCRPRPLRFPRGRRRAGGDRHRSRDASGPATAPPATQRRVAGRRAGEPGVGPDRAGLPAGNGGLADPASPARCECFQPRSRRRRRSLAPKPGKEIGRRRALRSGGVWVHRRRAAPPDLPARVRRSRRPSRRGMRDARQAVGGKVFPRSPLR